jgi:hypothetical protein
LEVEEIRVEFGGIVALADLSFTVALAPTRTSPVPPRRRYCSPAR